MYGIRIVIADNDLKHRSYVKQILTKAGYNVVGEAADGYSAFNLTNSTQPDVLLINSQLPGRDGLDVAIALSDNKVAPVIVMCELHRKPEVQRVMERFLLSYVLKPVDEYGIVATIDTVILMHRKIRTLERDNAKLTQSIESRKLVDHAKGLLIEKRGMAEPQAFKYLQKTSMDKCVPIANVAKAVIKKLDLEQQAN